jgi:glyoxylase-like metal-dependent hydrolase (beta-lactamase superfamily II)
MESGASSIENWLISCSTPFSRDREAHRAGRGVHGGFQLAPLTEKIVAAIREITDKPIRFMVNTHVDPDYTGGNENLGKIGVVIISQDEVFNRFANPAPGANGAPGRPAPARPLITYTGRLRFHMNGDDVELVPSRALTPMATRH